MKKIKFIINPLLHIGLVCFISIMVSKYLSVIKPFKIDTIEISGNEYIDNTQVLKTIKEYTNDQNIINIYIVNLYHLRISFLVNKFHFLT